MLLRRSATLLFSASLLSRLFVRSLPILFSLITLCATAQDIEGAWIGYALDLQQLKSDNLPKVYTIKMVVQKKEGNNYQGVLSRHWENYFNTISGFNAVLDPKTKMLSLSERGQFKNELIIDKDPADCKILSSLSITKEQNKWVLEGKYYGVSNSSILKECPSGKIHLERPMKDSLSFKFLQDFLQSKMQPNLAKSSHPDEKEALKTSPSSMQKDPENILAYFPEIVVSTSPYAHLERTLHYDVYQLAKTQKIKRTEKAIVSDNPKMYIVISSNRSDGDTLNLMFDGIKIATNHKLNSFSPISIDIDLKGVPKADIDSRYTYYLSIVPFSWVKKDMKILIETMNERGERVSSVPYSFSSEQTLEIPLTLVSPPKK